MASGHVSRIKRPNTWLHRPMLQNVKKALAKPEPSTHGTSNIARCSTRVRNALQSRHRGGRFEMPGVRRTLAMESPPKSECGESPQYRYGSMSSSGNALNTCGGLVGAA